MTQKQKTAKGSLKGLVIAYLAISFLCGIGGLWLQFEESLDPSNDTLEHALLAFVVAFLCPTMIVIGIIGSVLGMIGGASESSAPDALLVIFKKK